MAEQAQTKAKGEPTAEESAPAEVDEPTYHRDRLVAESHAFFGVPSHVVVGAFEHAKGNRVNFTRAQAERAIKDFLDHPVETTYADEEA